MNGRLIIQKLVLDGLEYRRILPFKDGLNIINGDKTSGKSLVLTLIDYCLGKSSRIDLNVQRELGNQIDRVFLGILINNDVLTIKRNLKTNSSNFSVFFSDFDERSKFTPKIFKRSEFLEFLLLQFDIPMFKLVKHKSHSDKKTVESLSFRDIMRYVYVNQHDFGTDNFLNYKSNNTRYKLSTAFEAIAKLIEVDISDMQNEKVQIENQIKEFETNIKGLKIYLKDKELSDVELVDRKLDEIEYEVNELKRQKKQIFTKLSDDKNDVETLYTNIKSRILDTNNKIGIINDVIREGNYSIVGKKNLLNNYDKDRAELEATVESLYKMKNCDHSLVCPICDARVNNPESDPISIEILLKSIKKIKQRRKLVDELINVESEKINNLNKEKEELIQFRDILEKSTKEYKMNIDVPFMPEIETISQLIGTFNAKKNSILEAKKIHNKIIEIEKLIIKSSNRLEKIIIQLQENETSLIYRTQFFTDLNNDYLEYMKRFKLKTNPEEVYIDDNNYFPYYDNAVIFSHTSGGLLECMQISYLVSLINRKISDLTINHPGILMLDTLGKYLGTNRIDDNSIKDPEVYDEIYKVLIETGEHIQIIVVDNTPPRIASQYVRYTFYDDGHGLINDEINHKEN